MWEYPTNVDFTTSNGFLNLILYLNSVTAGWFSNFLLIAVLIIFASGYYFTSKDFWGGFAVGGFVTSVLAIIMWISGILSVGSLIIALAIAIISFVGLFVKASE